MAMGRLVISPLLLLVALSGCTLHRDAFRLERDRLREQLKASAAVEEGVANGTIPGPQRHIELFLSYDAFNQVLAAADGLEVPLPEHPDVVVKVHEMRFEPRYGVPMFRFAGSAVRGEIELEIVARAFAVVDTGTSQPMVQVRVEDVAPVFSWKGIKFGRWRLARLVATAKADQLALNEMSFPLPLEQAVVLSMPAVLQNFQVATPRGNGSTVDIRITRDAINLSRTVRVDRVFFLRDGVHIGATVM